MTNALAEGPIDHDAADSSRSACVHVLMEGVAENVVSSWAPLYRPTEQVVVGTLPGPGQVQSVGQEPARSFSA